jgi:hypothetical protein
MARINIEEKWWSDFRRLRLTEKLGLGTADGAFFIACRKAQEFCGEPFDATGEMPFEWIEALLSCGLASGSPTAFYLKGSREHHEWVKKLRQNAQKGGLSRRNKISIVDEASAKQLPSSSLAVASPLSSLLSSTTLTTQKKPTKPPINWDQIKADCIASAQSRHGYSYEFCQARWEELLIWAEDREVKNKKLQAHNWFANDITKRKWDLARHDDKFNEVVARLSVWDDEPGNASGGIIEGASQ